jgi:hypothetical protein
MNQQLPTNTPINESGDEDYVYQQWLEQEKMNESYWTAKAEETMDRINAYYDTRYCAADVEGAIAEVTNDERIIAMVMRNLNEIYLKRTVYELQQIPMVDTK